MSCSTCELAGPYFPTLVLTHSSAWCCGHRSNEPRVRWPKLVGAACRRHTHRMTLLAAPWQKASESVGVIDGSLMMHEGGGIGVALEPVGVGIAVEPAWGEPATITRAGFVLRVSPAALLPWIASRPPRPIPVRGESRTAGSADQRASRAAAGSTTRGPPPEWTATTVGSHSFPFRPASESHRSRRRLLGFERSALAPPGATPAGSASAAHRG